MGEAIIIRHPGFRPSAADVRAAAQADQPAGNSET